MKRRPLALFFAFAYAVSWLFWAPAVLARLGWIGPVPSRVLHLAGGLGPMLAAIAVTVATGGRPALARLGRGCVMGRRWLLIAVLIPAALFFAATAIVAAFYGETIEWANIGRGTELADLPLGAYWLANLVFYGFGEEVGWRGFALPRLQSRAPALRASLLLALGWAGWHLPLFAFSPGLSNLGVAGAAGWLVSLCLGSILLTWLFNSSGGSIAAVALFHAALDIFMMSPVAPSLVNVMGAILTMGTVLLIPIFGRESLSRRPRVVEPRVLRANPPIGHPPAIREQGR
jgi:uncharacterized protein